MSMSLETPHRSTDLMSRLLSSVKDLPEHEQALEIARRFLLEKSENTRRSYACDLKAWFQCCSDQQTDPLKVNRAASAALLRCIAEGVSKSTYARRLASINGFYRYAVYEEVVTVNPIQWARRPKVSTDSQTLGLSIGESKALITTAHGHSPRAAALVTLLLHDGLRVSEALNADITDLTKERGHDVLTVTRKGGARRSVYLNTATKSAIDDYLDGRRSGPIFVTSTGKRWDRAAVFQLVRRLAYKTGIPHAEKISPHSLRHTFVTLALDAGVPLRDVQDAAGHSTPGATRRYDRSRYALERHPAHVLSGVLG